MSSEKDKEQDIGWQHGTPVGGNKKKVKCKYCGKVISGGVSRLKHHLAAKQGEVAPCPKVSKEIRLAMLSHLTASKSLKNKQAIQKENREARLQEMDHEEDEHIHISDSDELNVCTQSDDVNLRLAMKRSRHFAFEDEQQRCGHEVGSASGSSSDIMRSEKNKQDATLRGIDPFLYRGKEATQKKLKTIWGGKETVEKVGRAIAKFFLYHALPFNAAQGPYYQTMIDRIAEAGPGIKGPTPKKISNKYLPQEVNELKDYISSFKSKLPEYGCTIMCDGWSSRTRKSIINFMIYCDRSMIFHKSIDASDHSKNIPYLVDLMEEVVDEIGEHNVVQIVTDNEAAFKGAGKELMIRKPHLYWSPCAAHCLDLILEDMGKLSIVKETITTGRKITSFIYNSNIAVNLMKKYTNDHDLLRPGITRFATEYISLESLLRYQSVLKSMFTSQEWLDIARTSDRKKRATMDEISNIILTNEFWQRAEDVLKVMKPLVKMLKIVDQDKKPTLPVVFESMVKAREEIKSSVRNCQRYLDVIDKRWSKQLHQDIHAAAFFLNPLFQYGKDHATNTNENFQSLKRVIKRLEPDLNKQGNAIDQIKYFVEANGEFGAPLTQSRIKHDLPAMWWYNYGFDVKELRSIAIKVLSQTCSSSGCERNFSTFSHIHSCPRNRLSMNRLEQLVFVHYNMRLRVRNLMFSNDDEDYSNPIDLEYLFGEDDVLDPWIRETEDPVLDEHDLSWLNQDINIPTQTEEDPLNDIANDDLVRNGRVNSQADGGVHTPGVEGEYTQGDGGVGSTQVSRLGDSIPENFVTQDSNHGVREINQDIEEVDPYLRQREYWSKISRFPSQDSDQTQDPYSDEDRNGHVRGNSGITIGGTRGRGRGRSTINGGVGGSGSSTINGGVRGRSGSIINGGARGTSGAIDERGKRGFDLNAS